MKESARGLLLAAILLAPMSIEAQEQDAPEPSEPSEMAAADESAEGAAEEPAQEPKELKTHPADAGFGQNQLAERYHFPGPEAYSARVDRRGELDATAHRTILLPTAHTPEKNTFSYSNFMFFYNQVSFSVSDKVQLGLGALFPSPTIDFVGGASAKFTLSEGPNSTVALQPFATHRNGRGELATNDAGAGVSLLADFVLTNDITTTLGATAYGTVWASTADYTYENCESRQDYLSGECREVETSSHPFPPGGHWLALHGAATYYLTDNFSLRGELITGGALGSVLGTEWLREDPGVDADEDRFLEGTAAVGIPFDSKITGGAGFAWTNGMFAVSLSGYLYRGQSVFENVDGTRDEIWVVTPMFNLAATF